MSKADRRAMMARLLAALLALAGLGGLAAPGAAATASPARPDIREVLSRHVEALGGLEKLRRFRNLVSEGTVSAGGLQGTFRGYIQAPTRSRSELDLNIVKQVQVTDGGAAWIQDQNGQVKQASGDELEGLITENVLENYQYLLAPPEEVSVKFASQDAESSQYVSLVVTPKGGEPAVLDLDPGTWLVRKRVQQSAAGRVEVYLDDYREVGGIKMPFHSTQILAGDAVHHIETSTTRAEAPESLPDSLWRKPGQSALDWSFPEGVRSLSLPIRVVEHHIFVPVRVNGSQPLTFLLDSGAGASVLERRRAEALGLKSEGKLGAQGVGGIADYGFTTVDTLEVGGATLHGQHLITIDLPDFESAVGLRVDGILGYDFISRFVVTLDYAQKTLTLDDPQNWRPRKPAAAIPIDLMQNVPVVHARYDGHPGSFIVDTGNNGTLLLHGPFVRRYRLLERARKSFPMTTRGAGGEETHTLIRGGSLVLGGHTVARPLVALTTSREGLTGSSAQLAGNIGGWILEQFVLTLDYEHRKMYLERSSSFGEKMELDHVGWQLLQRDHQLVVGGVPAGTPAARAGIQEGDVVLQLEQQDVSSLAPWEMRRLTDRAPGQRLRFTLRRGDRRLTAEVILRNIL